MAYVARLFPKMGIGLLQFHQMEEHWVIEQIHELLRDKIRKMAGKEISSSMNLIDNQHVKRRQ